MIVDNSIVVLESCMRCKEEGLDFREAAATGTATMLMSILAGTLTTVVVYIPMAMADGLVGMMTGPLSWTILLTLLCSFLCAVVVVPLAFLWLKPRNQGSAYYQPASWAGSRASTAGPCPGCCATRAGGAGGRRLLPGRHPADDPDGICDDGQQL